MSYIKFIRILVWICILSTLGETSKQPKSNNPTTSKFKKFKVVNNLKEAPVIGYWMHKKKYDKMKWSKFEDYCKSKGYKLLLVDLEKPLEEQDPFAVFLPVFTSLIPKTDAKTVDQIKAVEKYLFAHPEIVVINPIENTRILFDRFLLYSFISGHVNAPGILTPPFTVLESNDPKQNLERLNLAKVKFPFVCKSNVAQGGADSHSMVLIFNKAGISACKDGWVAQSFINHNGLLFKIFVIGDEHHVVERTSIKNFKPSDGMGNIKFTTDDVSKTTSKPHVLTTLDPADRNFKPNLDENKLNAILKMFREKLDLSLFGLDVIVEVGTNDHYIIDVNSFPGYDGLEDVYGSLWRCIENKMNKQKAKKMKEQKEKQNKKKTAKPSKVNKNSRKRKDGTGTSRAN